MEYYVDGYLLPLKKDKVEDYKKLAEEAMEIWMDHGALEYTETVLEDETDYDFCMSFAGYVKPKEDETIVFSFIKYKSREHRDEVNAAVMEDPRMDKDMEERMPFDSKRMAFGGFKVIASDEK